MNQHRKGIEKRRTTILEYLKGGMEMNKLFFTSIILLLFCFVSMGYAALEVPPEIKMPGTQPEDGVTIEAPTRCLNCHEGYEANPRVEPGFGWLGSAMGNAGRDPIFWATLAIAEQDFDGAGDLCIRCHSSGGWISGRSTPTDGSGLAASDEDGIDCDTCHQLTNPDQGEHIGVFNTPFEPFEIDDATGALEAYYGSGMYVLSNDYGKLGPYAQGDAVARHMFTESNFHRDQDFCGTCHDVSNSVVGDLAPNAGTQPGAPAVINSWGTGPGGGPNIGGPVEDKAAFNNPPYAYGIVERTFSEYKSSPLSNTLVDDFTSLPADLQDPRGSLYNAYMAATRFDENPPTANYVDGDPRYFSCQTCHMRAITGRGCDKNNAPNRRDQPMHDQTGGNYWVYPLVQYQDQQGTLRLGGGLSALQIEAMDDGTLRAKSHLTQAGTLDVNGDLVRITNMTGHKLISGYPEGRRMWLNIKWFDASGVEMTADETGAWGELPTTATNPVDGSTFIPKSIVNLEDARLKVYEVHPAMTREWAQVLLSVDAQRWGPKDLGFDRITGASVGTISDLANGTIPGHENAAYHETFHFALNNHVAFDNRIPPYRMSYDEAKKRNSLPVPDFQYGNPGAGGVYQHWDEFNIAAIAPAGAVSANLTLYYQGTSWEYVQFLNNAVILATDPPTPGEVTPFLADEGKNFLDAWVNAVDANGNTMVPPHVMATATWGVICVPEPEICDDTIDNDCDNQVDCNDPDCNDDLVNCPNLIEFPFCFDGLDNDSDGFTDCADRTDCDGVTETCGLGVCASTGSQCNNGTLIEAICTPGDPTEPGTELTCDNNLDDDCDGLTDTNDPDCMACSDYMNKGDCNMDPNCEWQGSPKNGMCVDAVVCTPTGPELGNCNDGIDNDCNGMTDCADTANCGNDPVCMMDCTIYTTQTECEMYPDICRWRKKQLECVNR
jgi:hypothetical protein